MNRKQRRAAEKRGITAYDLKQEQLAGIRFAVRKPCMRSAAYFSRTVIKMRIDKDNYYLNIAEAVAQRSTCLRRQYGAVIVAGDEIIATGYNGAPRGEVNCCDTGKCYRCEHSEPIDCHAATHGDQYGTCVAVHAEQNAIISAARRDMQGATLYLACLDKTIDPAPCNICDRMIKNAGITRVVTRAGTF